MIPILFGSCYLSSHFSLSVKISTEHSSGQPLHSSHISTKGPLLEALTPMIEYFCQYFIIIVFFIFKLLIICWTQLKSVHTFSHFILPSVLPWIYDYCYLHLLNENLAACHGARWPVTKQGAASGWLHSRARSFSLIFQSLPLGLCLAIPDQIDLWLWFFWDIS